MESVLNTLSTEQFVHLFGCVFEHGTWLAERVEKKRPFVNWDDLELLFTSEVNSLTHEEGLRLLRSYPQLSTTKRLEKFSHDEHEAAGLHKIDSELQMWMDNFNANYYKKFAFPFIVCVKLMKTPQNIIENMKSRLDASIEEEYQTALVQVQHIARIRLNEIKQKNQYPTKISA